MLRRDLSKTLIASLTTPGLKPSGAPESTQTRDWHRDTAAEIAARVTPVDRTFEPYEVSRYGADPTGSTDSTLAFNNAFLAASYAAGLTVRAKRGGMYKVTGPLNIDTTKVGFDGEGCLINCSSLTHGPVWCPAQSAPDVNRRPLLSQAHPIANFTIRGPGKQHSSVVAVRLVDTAQPPTLCGVTFQNVGFQDWGQDVYFGDGSFCTQFINCSFGVTVAGSSGAGTVYSVTMAAKAVNAGERNTFLACAWYNKELVAQNLNGNADLVFMGCSFDGMRRAFNVAGGTIFVIGGHIEMFGSDADNCGHVSGANSSLILDSVQIVIGTSRSNFDVFWSDSTVVNGGVFLDNCFLGTGSTTITAHLVGGTGPFRIRNLIQSQYADRATLGRFMNQLAYGDFESPRYAADWLLTSGAVRSGAHSHSGSYSLSFPASAGTTPSASMTRACKAGQYVQGELWYLTPDIGGTGARFTVDLHFLDNGGNPLSSSTELDTTTSVSSWRKLRFKLIPPAPMGTCFARLLVSLSRAEQGTPTAYIDDVIVNLTE